MITLAKIFLVAAITTAGACGVGAVCTATYLYTGGIAAVGVETSEVDLFVPVPLRLADVGFGIARLATPGFDLNQEIDAETRRKLDELMPMMEELVDEVGSLPPGELVRVDNGTEVVVVRVVRGNLRVEVDSPDARVRVSIPQKGARRVLRQALRLARL